MGGEEHDPEVGGLRFVQRDDEFLVRLHGCAAIVRYVLPSSEHWISISFGPQSEYGIRYSPAAGQASS